MKSKDSLFSFTLGLGLLFSGCHTRQELTGTQTRHRPQAFAHENVFYEGDDLQVSLDEARVRALDLDNKNVEIRVVRRQSPCHWNSCMTLPADRTGQVERKVFQTGALGSLHMNRTLVWPDMSDPRLSTELFSPYDVVLDLPSYGTFCPCKDVVDTLGAPPTTSGLSRGGFLLMRNPGDAGPLPTERQDYDGLAINFGTPPGTDAWVEFKGEIYYPRGLVPGGSSSHAFVLLVHGFNDFRLRTNRGTSYQGFRYLGEHLASHGMIAASIGIHHTDRIAVDNINNTILGADHGDLWAEAVLHHYNHLLRFHWISRHIDSNRTGMLGHSFGGFATVLAARNQPIQALVGLAPESRTRTGHSSSPIYGSPLAKLHNDLRPQVPYLLILGTADNATVTGRNSGVPYHDLAQSDRSMVVIRGANHMDFNTDNNDLDEFFPSPRRSGLLEADLVRDMTKTFVTAHFLRHLYRTTTPEVYEGYGAMFRGRIPSRLSRRFTKEVSVSDQTRNSSDIIVDEFNDPDTAKNDLGGDISSTTMDEEIQTWPTSTNPPPRFPTHDIQALRLTWGPAGAHYQSGLEVLGQPLSIAHKRWLRFRVGIPHDSLGGIDLDQNVWVELTADGRSARVSVDTFTPIRGADPNNYNGARRRAYMVTVHIPLRTFTVDGLDLDLSKAEMLRFILPAVNNPDRRQLLISDIAFVGRDKL